jgi:hypothetical protein
MSLLMYFAVSTVRTIRTWPNAGPGAARNNRSAVQQFVAAFDAIRGDERIDHYC